MTPHSDTVCFLVLHEIYAHEIIWTLQVLEALATAVTIVRLSGRHGDVGPRSIVLVVWISEARQAIIVVVDWRHHASDKDVNALELKLYF